MSRRVFTTYLAAAALTIATIPVAAQDKGQQGARPNPSGSNTGSAVSRGGSGGGGGGSTGSSAGAGSTSSAGSSSGTSMSSGRPGGGGSNDGGGYRAPSRPEYRGGSRAVPRSSVEPASGGDQRRMGPAGATSASSSDDADGRRRVVPAYARPRDGRPTTGSAVERSGFPPVRGGTRGGLPYGYYDPYFRSGYYYNSYPYGYFWPGYGFGVGYFYDPWLWGSPYGSYGGYDPYFYGGGGGYSYRQGRYGEVGNVRLKVKPTHAQVFVDGYFVGEVDSFDGVFQRLTVEAGARKIELRAEGYEPVQFEVMVVPGETVTYKGELRRIQ